MQLDIFSKRLKELMELEGCSIRALASKIGADRKSVRLWLSSVFYPKSEAMIKLSISLNRLIVATKEKNLQAIKSCAEKILTKLYD